MPKPVRIVTHSTVIAIANLMRLLQRGALTMAELAEESGLNKNTVERYCAALHRAGACYIAEWRKDARGVAYTVRVYCLGEGIDAVFPTITPAERAKRQRQARAALRREFERTGVFDQGRAARTVASHAATC